MSQVVAGGGVDDPDELQRAASTFYGRGRRFATLRLVVLFALVVSPVVVRPDTDWGPAWAAGAAIWVAIEFLVIRRAERRWVSSGALAQEMSDRKRFGWDWPTSFPPPHSDLVVRSAASRTPTFDEPWYSDEPVDHVSIRAAIAESATYTTAQLRLFRGSCVAGLLALLLLQVLLVRDWTVNDFLLRLALPTIPAVISVLSLLDVHQQELEEWTRIDERARSDATITDLQDLQGDVFRARARFPLMPEWVYRLVKRGLSAS